MSPFNRGKADQKQHYTGWEVLSKPIPNQIKKPAHAGFLDLNIFGFVQQDKICEYQAISTIGMALGPTQGSHGLCPSFLFFSFAVDGFLVLHNGRYGFKGHFK